MEEIEEKNDLVPAEKDWFLQQLVNLDSNWGAEYFKLFSEDIANMFDEENTENKVSESFLRFGDVYNDKSKVNPTPTFIHLKNTKYFNTFEKPIPATGSITWRGRLSEISGFSLGTLSSK